MDEKGGRSGVAYVAGRASEPDVLDIYKATGRHVSTMSRKRYQHLYSRYMGVTTAVKVELTNKGFIEELVSLVGRYQGTSGVGKEKWFRNHWTVPEGIMDAPTRMAGVSSTWSPAGGRLLHPFWGGGGLTHTHCFFLYIIIYGRTTGGLGLGHGSFCLAAQRKHGDQGILLGVR
jgi:hypothetical protein